MTHTFKLSRRTARLRAMALVSALTVIGACSGAESFDPTAADNSTQPSFSTTGTSVSISNISVSSGTTYRVGSGLGVGSGIYVDRSYTYSSVPSGLAGLSFIQTANADKDANLGSNSFLSFDVNVNANVYVGHDNRITPPTWLTSNYQDTGLDLLSSDGLTRYSVFKRSVAAGRVTLGSNSASDVVDGSMYVVAVQPASTTTTSTSTTSLTSSSGMPFGFFHLPNTQFTSVNNGALRNIWPAYLLSDLASIKSHGGKVMLALSGARSNYTNSDGTFSFTKWKARVDQFRTINFSSYLSDGTIMGHYLTDEPNCASCWGGTAISPATLEAMAQYSKSIWPNMPTIVRVYPDYLNTWSGTYNYLDAAWAQYVYRKGDPATFLSDNIAQAQKKGLALVIGLNVLRGGVNNAAMTATQVQTWGSALLTSSYPCAFLSWEYDATYLSTTSMKSALAALSDKAKTRTFRTCKGA